MRHCRTDYEAGPSTAGSLAMCGLFVGHGWIVVFDAPSIDERAITPLIPDDEPVFVIRSRDVNGPNVVRHWAFLTDAAGGDRQTTLRVLRWADEMQAWGEANGAKVPDTPADLLRPIPDEAI